MSTTRRAFLKLAALAALGVGGGAFEFLDHGVALASGLPDPALYASGIKAARWGMVVFTDKCTPERIAACRAACHREHNVPDIPGRQEIKWFWGAPFAEAFPEQEGEYLSSDVASRTFPLLCNHCQSPMCVKVCPTQATFQRPDGIVMMDYHRCIGCRYCMAGCPYGARSFNFQDPRPFLRTPNPDFPTRTKGVVEKCDFCAERLALGKLPVCVEASEGALVFGDLSDEDSVVRRALREHFALRRKPDAGTSPCVYYIV